GIVLKGTEIKAIRAGRVNLNAAHDRIMNGEAQLINMHIAPYEHVNRFNYDPTRSRKVLLHLSEIDKMYGLVKQKVYAIIPLKLYIKHGYAKILIGVGKGKKKYDKREDMKRKRMKRDADRAVKENMQ